MRHHHLTLFVFLLSSTVLGAVVPSFEQRDRSQLANEAALEVRDRGPLEARDERKFKPGMYFTVNNDSGIYPPNKGCIIIQKKHPTSFYTAMITDKPLAGPGQHPPRIYVSDYVADTVVVRVVGGAMSNGPYSIVLVVVELNHLVKCHHRRWQWIFKLPLSNLEQRLEINQRISNAEDNELQKKAQNNKRKNSPFYSHLIKGSPPDNPKWAFVYQCADHARSECLVAVWSFACSEDSISATDFLPKTKLPGPAKQLVTKMKKDGCWISRGVHALSELETPIAESQDDFHLPKETGMLMFKALNPQLDPAKHDRTIR